MPNCCEESGCCPEPKRPRTLLDEEDSSLLTEFLAWMERENITISEKVKVTKINSCHRYGMVAVKYIEKEEVLFKVPSAALLWHKSSSIHELLENSTKELQSKSGWSELLTCLMFEYTKPDSKFAAYLRILPEVKELDHPMFWNEQERKVLLRGTGCDEAVESDLANIKEEFETIVQPFIEANQMHGFDKEKHNFDLYKHMVALVMAYSFSDGGTKMVPLADILNHISQNNARIESEEGYLSMVAERDINVGEEIYNTYGQHENASLLQNYGFVEKFQENEFDYVKIPLTNVMKIAEEKYQDDFVNVKEKKDFLKRYFERFPPYPLIVSDNDFENAEELYITMQVLRLDANQFAEHASTPFGEEDVLLDTLTSIFDTVEGGFEVVSFQEFAELFNESQQRLLVDVVDKHIGNYPSGEELEATESTQTRKRLAGELIRGQLELLNNMKNECRRNFAQ